MSDTTSISKEDIPHGAADPISLIGNTFVNTHIRKGRKHQMQRQKKNEKRERKTKSEERQQVYD